MAYSGNGYEGAEDLPFKIVPGDQPLHRESIFLERAIAGERVRLAMGLSIRPVQTRSLMTEGMDAAAISSCTGLTAEEILRAAPYQHHSIRLSRLPHQPVPGDGELPELSGSFLPAGLSQGRSLLRQRQEPH